MSYKTLLVPIDNTARSSYRIKLAAELALQHDAHLMGVAETGISRFIYQNGNLNGIDPGILVHLEELRQRAAQHIEAFNTQMSQLGVASFSSEVAEEDVFGHMGRQARYCDLVMIGQTDPDETTPVVANDFPEYMIVHSGRPVLVIPYLGEFPSLGKRPLRPLIAWDESRAAARAIIDAMPFLSHAESVNVVIINPDDEQSDTQIASYLARHGIQTEVTTHQTQLDTTSALLSIASDLHSDLLVMGGYGHSRFREMVMGGVTRSMLKKMTIPTLFSH